MAAPIVLIGLSGAGKTTAGALLARTLGRPFLDTDAMVEAATNRSIARIFAEGGEAEFRRLETNMLRLALLRPDAVIATGGGIVEGAGNAKLLQQAVVVWLQAEPETLAGRLAAHRDRPLLQSDALGTLRAQAERRTPHYQALATFVVSVVRLAPEQTVDRILALMETPMRQLAPLQVTMQGTAYDVVVEPGALDLLPEYLDHIAPKGRAWIVSDDRVWPFHGGRLLGILREAGISAQYMAIPAGETSKNLAVAQSVYDWLLAGGVERGDALLAFGGGVVGDLAGFVASTVLRGIALIQLPTTLLAMVDSSIGGKTGVDHAMGKNLIGTFYQPKLVLADPTLLQSMPEPERRVGWAEAIKHGVILDRHLFEDLVAHEPALRSLSEPLTSALIRRAAAVKVGVVSGDEREQGDRMLLNYGHTIGHALEHWSDYAISHGEAVAMGMGVAATIAHRLGLCDDELLSRQDAALRAFGLPTRLPPNADPRAILEAARSDKKTQQQRLRWVLPTEIGRSMVRGDVPDNVVLEAVMHFRA